VAESHIYYLWQNLDSVHTVERAMLPNATGEAITIPAGDSVTVTRNFTIDAAWDAHNCHLVAFLQNNSTKVILQGARAGVIPQPNFGYVAAPGTFAQPGQSVSFSPVLRNVGTAPGRGVTGTLSTTDPYVTVTQANASWPEVAVAADEPPSTPFTLDLAAGTPGDHLASLQLILGCGDDMAETLAIPLLVTPGSGLTDDMESGTGGWTVSGLNNRWDQTTTRSHSPTHSWACSPSGQYPNMSDMYLVSPYFLVGNGASLSFWHQYAVELDYDYCMVELNGGGPFWQAVTSYTGTLSNWTQQTLDISRYGGSTLRVRFRFISDSSVQGLGWFVDDVLVNPFVADVTEGAAAAGWRVAVAVAPVKNAARIGYAIPAGQIAALSFYDASGRLVAGPGEKLTGTGTANWNLLGADGRRVPAGQYFVRLSGANSTVAKFVVTE